MSGVNRFRLTSHDVRVVAKEFVPPASV